MDCSHVVLVLIGMGLLPDGGLLPLPTLLVFLTLVNVLVFFILFNALVFLTLLNVIVFLTRVNVLSVPYLR